jgi:hypothetical protein
VSVQLRPPAPSAFGDQDIRPKQYNLVKLERVSYTYTAGNFFSIWMHDAAMREGILCKKKTGIPILGYGKVEDLFKLKEKGEGHA